jgi:hypothetical protein
MRIYITHCSAKKDNSLKDTRRLVTPDQLYTATPTKRFMQRCKDKNVKWAIFSDRYGVWFPDLRHEWYEKDPDTANEEEYANLLNEFDENLKDYDEIWFYHNPGRFHPLYKRLLAQSRLKDRIRLFTHISQITREGKDV